MQSESLRDRSYARAGDGLARHITIVSDKGVMVEDMAFAEAVSRGT